MNLCPNNLFGRWVGTKYMLGTYQASFYICYFWYNDMGSHAYYRGLNLATEISGSHNQQSCLLVSSQQSWANQLGKQPLSVYQINGKKQTHNMYASCRLMHNLHYVGSTSSMCYNSKIKLFVIFIKYVLFIQCPIINDNHIILRLFIDFILVLKTTTTKCDFIVAKSCLTLETLY